MEKLPEKTLPLNVGCNDWKRWQCAAEFPAHRIMLAAVQNVLSLGTPPGTVNSTPL
jgi:hypothetical protein